MKIALKIRDIVCGLTMNEKILVYPSSTVSYLCGVCLEKKQVSFKALPCQDGDVVLVHNNCGNRLMMPFPRCSSESLDEEGWRQF